MTDADRKTAELCVDNPPEHHSRLSKDYIFYPVLEVVQTGLLDPNKYICWTCLEHGRIYRFHGGIDLLWHTAARRKVLYPRSDQFGAARCSSGRGWLRYRRGYTGNSNCRNFWVANFTEKEAGSDAHISFRLTVSQHITERVRTVIDRFKGHVSAPY